MDKSFIKQAAKIIRPLFPNLCIKVKEDLIGRRGCKEQQGIFKWYSLILSVILKHITRCFDGAGLLGFVCNGGIVYISNAFIFSLKYSIR